MTVFNPKPSTLSVSNVEPGYSIVKVRFGTDTDYDLSSVGGWIRRTVDTKDLATYNEILYDLDNRIFSFRDLTIDTGYTATLSFLDTFVLASPELVQAQYLKAVSESANLTNITTRTLTPIVVTSIVSETTESVVGNPFATVSIEFTGTADELRLEILDLNNPGAVWVPLSPIVKPVSGLTLSMLGGTYQVRYSSVKVFTDGESEVSPATIYPDSIIIESGLSAPPSVSGGTLAAYKAPGTLPTYSLRVNWNFPNDLSSQNRKRNFTVSLAANPSFSTNYASLDWSASQGIAIDNYYVYSTFPYRTPYAIRVTAVGWGVEASESIYLPVFISRDTADSSKLGYLVPSENEYTSSTKIQIDDEFIRAYKVYDSVNPLNNIKVFEVDANSGNVIIGTPGGVYGGGSALTTAPFIFDATSKKLQISGRTITDQIESASYVLSWIDGAAPSFRTAGKTNFASNAPGVWMGYTNPTTFMFDLGNDQNYIRWNGFDLTISGTVRIGSDGRTLGQAQKQIFIYRRDVSTPNTPTGGSFYSPIPGGWSSVVPTGTDDVYMCSRLFTTDGAPPQEVSWSTPSLFSPGAAAGSTAAYTWIKYADDSIGTGLSDDPTGKSYIGIAVNKPSPTESTNAIDYSWSLLTGTGIPGEDGEDGITTYTWIKYSEFPTGSPSLTDSPDANTVYIGISTNRTTATESTDPADYVWSKFKGDQGVPGPITFKSTVFIRATDPPNPPSGGSYASPVPAGWSDGVPSGTLQLWASTRVFSQNGLAPQQASWTTPMAMTSTSSLEIQYSSVDSTPGTPITNPANWSASASITTIWLAQRTITNGVSGQWEVSRIKGEAGVGIPGAAAKSIRLVSSTNVISFDSANALVPAGQTVQFSVSRQNLSASTSWSAIDDSSVNVTGLLSGQSNTGAALSGSSLSGRKHIRVTVTCEGFSDTVTVVKVSDGVAGKDSVVGVLSNEAHIVSADKSGVVASWDDAGGTFKLFKGTTDVTLDSSFAVVSATNVTGTISALGVYSVTDMSADQGTLLLRGAYQSTTIDKVFTITKSKEGAIGRRGAGRYSAAFTNPTATITDAMAIAAAAATPEGVPVPADVVTLYDSADSTKLPRTIIYNSGNPSLASSWAGFSVQIDGNLLVNGSIRAEKINVDDLYAQSANIAGSLQVGSGSTYTTIDGSAGGITAVVGGNTVFSAGLSGGFLQGRDIAAGTIGKNSLSPELQEWISLATQGGGGEYTTGGSQSVSSTMTTTIYTLNPIPCAAGSVELTLSYGGNTRRINSAYIPTDGTIQYRFLRNGSPISSYVTLTGSVASISDEMQPMVTYYCTMPTISVDVVASVQAGSQVFGVQLIVQKPEGSIPNSWFEALGAVSFGAFQAPAGGSVGGGGSTTLDGLLDVSTAGAVNGSVLVFNSASGLWVPGSGGGGSGSALTFGPYFTGGSYNGSSAVTLGINASSTNTASYIVARNSSGDFSAGTITATLNGPAASLSNSRSISMTGDIGWSVSFNGSSNVSATATLTNTAVSPGTYGSSSTVPVITVDSKGRVTSASSVGIPTATPTSIFSAGTSVTLNSYGANIQAADSGSTYIYLQGGVRGGIIGTSSTVSLWSPGLGTALITSSTSQTNSYAPVYAPDFYATSDKRVKSNIVPIYGAIDLLKKISGYTYTRDDLNNSPGAGVIAQELLAVLPNAVDCTDPANLKVNHGATIAILVQVCKEQQVLIESLMERLNGDS